MQRVNPGLKGGNAQVSVNHIQFTSAVPLMNIAVERTHEWLVTSNFHQFHQHTWPYQLQNNVVDGWLAQVGDWRDVMGYVITIHSKPLLYLYIHYLIYYHPQSMYTNLNNLNP